MAYILIFTKGKALLECATYKEEPIKMSSEKQHNIAYLQAYLQRIEKDLEEIEDKALKRIEQQLHDLNQSG